jgi:hypothetical protein
MLDHVTVVDWPSVIVVGFAEIVTVGAGGGFTVTCAEPDFVESWTLVAMIVTCIADVTTVGAV